MAIFCNWKIVAVLEISLDLKVVAAVNDGAFPNRKFFNLHENLSGSSTPSVIYKRYCNIDTSCCDNLLSRNV